MLVQPRSIQERRTQESALWSGAVLPASIFVPESEVIAWTVDAAASTKWIKAGHGFFQFTQPEG